MRRGHLTSAVLASVAAVAPLVFGYTLGFTSPSNIPMEASQSSALFPAALASCSSPPCGLSSSSASAFGSVVNVGCMFGALAGGSLCDSLGRRGAIGACSLPFCAAWLLQALAPSFAVLMVGRVLCGLAVGIASTSVPRGAMGALTQLAVTGGIFLVYFLGFALQSEEETIFPCDPSSPHDTCKDSFYRSPHLRSPGTVDAEGKCFGELAPWRLLAFIAAGVSCLMLLGVVCCLPETPSHLAKTGRPEEARRVLTRIRNSPEEAERELEQLTGTACPVTTTLAGEGGEVGQLTGFIDAAPAERVKRTGLRGLCAKSVRACHLTLTFPT
ncbi:MAG: hypothetical protein SGPRY_000568 [Prymnesium sp.]